MHLADLLAAHPLVQAVRGSYGADYAERELDCRDYAELYESQWLGGDMGIRTVFLSEAGEAILDEARRAALECFDRVMVGYFAQAAKFVPNGPYQHEADHAFNEYDPGSAWADIDAYERINDAYWDEIEQRRKGEV